MVVSLEEGLLYFEFTFDLPNNELEVTFAYHLASSEVLGKV